MLLDSRDDRGRNDEKKTSGSLSCYPANEPTSWGQVDVGGAIQGAINGATGTAQQATGTAQQATGTAQQATGNAQATANAQTPSITNAQAPNAAPPKAAVGGTAGANANAAVNPPQFRRPVHQAPTQV